MKAIIRTGGKQYLVEVGQKLGVEKLEDVSEAKAVLFEDVLAVIDEKENITVGAPIVKGAIVEATFVKQYKEKKIDILKYKNKTRYRKRYGHRQPKTEVQISKIALK